MSAQPSPPPGPAGTGDAARGGRLPKPTPPRFRWRWWIAWVLGLLVINYWVASRATQAPPRVRVPYSPFFVQQVRDGHVASITSKGTAVQGTFTGPESYAGSKKTTRFRTEVPSLRRHERALAAPAA